MKKSTLTIAMTLLMLFCLSACGEKPAPIALPAAEDVTSIEIAGGKEDTICTEKEKIAAFLQKASASKLTAEESVQDVPTVSKYTRVDLVCDGTLSSLFIYEKNAKWYIERPYEGIYETDESILATIQ